jgi:hypothetical protein
MAGGFSLFCGLRVRTVFASWGHYGTPVGVFCFFARGMGFFVKAMFFYGFLSLHHRGVESVFL